MPDPRRLTTSVVAAACLVALATPARAQYTGLNDPATGESYHLELAGGLWRPTLSAVVASESLGIVGSEIDVVDDLGFTNASFMDVRGVLKMGRRNKLRVAYVPVQYEASATLQRSVTFNGIRFNIGVPVTSTFEFKTWRFGYEVDIIARDRGFLGLVLEAKYTDVGVTLDSPIANEFASAKAPVPAVGLIGRVYVMPNIAITGELGGIKTFDWEFLEGNRFEYWDLDIYGTLNFTNNFGVQAGYRRLNVEYGLDQDSGNVKLAGPYANGVIRF